MSAWSEDDVIARYFAPLAGPAGLGLRDDAALLAVPAGHEMVATVDALVAGVHFFADDPPGAIARKAVRVNLSDLAAKAADPLGLLLTLALPDGLGPDWLAAFADGLGGDLRQFATPLIGGDTVRMPGPLTLSITALGCVPAGQMVPRTGAQVGDLLYVTGTVGDAALGLGVRQPSAADRSWVAGLKAAEADALRERYLVPQPRLALRDALRRGAHAAMDVSDGLVGDAAKMLRVSGVGGAVQLEDVPLSAAARAAVAIDAALLDRIVTGGDDYEILASVPPASAAAFERDARDAGLAVTAIGHVEQQPGLQVVDVAGQTRAFRQPSFSHF